MQSTWRSLSSPRVVGHQRPHRRPQHSRTATTCHHLPPAHSLRMRTGALPTMGPPWGACVHTRLLTCWRACRRQMVASCCDGRVAGHVARRARVRTRIETCAAGFEATTQRPFGSAPRGRARHFIWPETLGLSPSVWGLSQSTGGRRTSSGSGDGGRCGQGGGLCDAKPVQRSAHVGLRVHCWGAHLQSGARERRQRSTRVPVLATATKGGEIC